MAAKWVTVTVTDPDGRRHSLDVQATSTYDAAHLYVVEAKKERAVGLAQADTGNGCLRWVTDSRVYRVKGDAPPQVDCGAAAEVEWAKGVHVHQTARAGVVLPRL